MLEKLRALIAQKQDVADALWSCKTNEQGRDLGQQKLALDQKIVAEWERLREAGVPGKDVLKASEHRKGTSWTVW